MNDLGEKWRKILETLNTIIGMLTGYVDDVRQKTTSARMGTRWDPESKTFKQDAAAKQEDLRLKYEMHETTNTRMVRICLPAINSVNTDLVFTAETPEKFPENKLPTLDFLLWLEKSGPLKGLLNHSYFKKPMKAPLVIMKDSAIGDHQRYSIISNELIRRLSNANPDNKDMPETCLT